MTKKNEKYPISQINVSDEMKQKYQYNRPTWLMIFLSLLSLDMYFFNVVPLVVDDSKDKYFVFIFAYFFSSS